MPLARTGTRTTLAAGLLVALGALAACGGGTDEPDGTSSPAPEPTEQTTATSEPEAPEDSGTAGPLDWQPTGHTVEERVVRGAGWTAVATETAVTFEPVGDGEPVVVPAVEGRSVDAVLLEGDRAVVSFAAGGETPTGAAVRVDLAASTPI